MAVAGTELGTAAHHRAASVSAAACGSALIASLILGGGTRSGFLADAALQLLSVPALLVIVYLWRAYEPGHEGRSSARGALAIMTGLVLLHLVQLVPLPPEIWTRLPGRTAVAKTFDLLGGDRPWMPLSADADATWYALLSLIPPIAILLGTVQAGWEARRRMVFMLIGFATFSALLGLLQVAQGPGSSLRPFSFTNPTEAVGLFANRNHYAALIYCGYLLVVPCAAVASQAFGASWQRHGAQLPPQVLMLAIFCFLAIFILICGQAMARSRAGLGLTLLAVVAGFFLPRQARGSDEVTTSRVAVAGLVMAMLLAVQFALYRNLERFETDPLADARIPFARNTIEAALAFMPFGSGIGTFVPVYGMFEKTADLHAAYANRAHNDLLEAWLETGVLGMLLLAAFLVWFLPRATSVWSMRPTKLATFDIQLSRAASVVIVLLLVHSVFDYPLRTGAMSAVMAFCLGLLVAPPESYRQLLRPAVDAEPAERLARRQAPRAAIPVDEPAPAGSIDPLPGPAWSTEAFARRMPPQPAQPAGPPGQGPDQRPGGKWGEDIAWPEAWRRQPEPRPGIPSAPAKPAKPPTE